MELGLFVFTADDDDSIWEEEEEEEEEEKLNLHRLEAKAEREVKLKLLAVAAVVILLMPNRRLFIMFYHDAPELNQGLLPVFSILWRLCLGQAVRICNRQYDNMFG